MIWFQLAQNRFTESPGLRTIEEILVERAVGADPRAEGDVNVDVANWICSGRRVACVSAWFRSRDGCDHSARVVIPAVTHKIRQTFVVIPSGVEKSLARNMDHIACGRLRAT